MRLHLLAIAFAVPACLSENPQGQPTMTGPDPNSPRVLDGLALLYTFNEGSGLVVHDRSGTDPALDLSLDNLVTNTWVEGGGIEITGSSLITTPDVAEKMFVDCVTANAVSLEVWLEPADITQQSTVFTYSKDNERNVTVYEEGARYRTDILQSSTDPTQTTGTISSISTPTNVATTSAQHVVYTRDATTMNLYFNGADTKTPSTQPTDPSQPPPPSTTQNVWSDSAQLALGNDINYGQPFLGKIYLAAVYCKKLSAAEVQKNYTAGYTF